MDDFSSDDETNVDNDDEDDDLAEQLEAELIAGTTRRQQ